MLIPPIHTRRETARNKFFTTVAEDLTAPEGKPYTYHFIEATWEAVLVVPVLEDRTFLKLKLDDVRHAGPDVPVYVMSSFATHERLLEHVEELGAKNVEVFAQFVSLRLTSSRLP